LNHQGTVPKLAQYDCAHTLILKEQDFILKSNPARSWQHPSGLKAAKDCDGAVL